MIVSSVVQSVQQWRSPTPDCMHGIYEHGSGPRLPGVAHRPARHAMQPLVEFPFPVLARLVGRRQQLQLRFRALPVSCPDEGRNVEPANEWPDAAIVVLVR